MAGRKPISDDRKKHPVTMYVSDEDLAVLNKYVDEHRASSRAWILYKTVFAYIKEELVPSKNVLFIPESAGLYYKDVEFCKQFLSDKSNLEILKDIKENRLLRISEKVNADDIKKLLLIMENKEKAAYLMSFVNDSKYLGDA